MKKLIAAVALSVCAFASCANAAALNYRVAGEGNVVVDAEHKIVLMHIDGEKDITGFHMVDAFTKDGWFNGVYQADNNPDLILIHGISPNSKFTTFVGGRRSTGETLWSWSVDDRYATVIE